MVCPEMPAMSHDAGPLVSIVTPCFNAAGTLRRTLDSVFGQTYPQIEVIVIDGGSTDGTAEILCEYAGRLAHWVSEPDRGIADAFNKGVGAARGALIGILNADDWLEPDAVAAVVAAHRRNPEAVVHGDLRYWLSARCSIVSPRREEIALARLPYHPAAFVPAALYARHGLFDESFRYAMDTDFLVRLFQSGVRFEHVPQVLANMSSGGVSTRDAATPYKERREIYRRAGMNPLRNQLLFAFFVGRMFLRLWVEKWLPH